MSVQTTRINQYESVVILDPSLSEDEQKDFFRKNKGIIENYDGEIKALDTWGTRPLANEINKVNRGAYFYSLFKANTDCVAELERTMRINDKVLRFAHIKLDAREDLDKHHANYTEVLTDAKKRYDEREAKFQARKAAAPKKFRKPSKG